MPDTRPTFTRSTSRLVNRVRARGIGEVARLGFERIRGAIRSEDELIVFVRPSGSDTEPTDDLAFREARSEDADAYARDIGTDSPSSFRSRLSDATHCFIVTKDRSIVHASWMTTAAAWTREIRGYMSPPPNDAYVYESYTRPEVRGRGVYPLALHSICAWGTTQNIARIWVAVEAHNPPSVRAVTKAGFEEAFRFAFRRRLGRLTIDPPTGQMAQTAISFVRRTH